MESKNTDFYQGRKILEDSGIGEKGMRVIERVTELMSLGGKGVLLIKNSALVKPAIEVITKDVQQKRVDEKSPLIEFLEIDFLEKGSLAWKEELEERLGKSSDYSFGAVRVDQEKNKENKQRYRLIYINTLLDEDAWDGMAKTNLYTKHGMSTLVVLPDINFDTPFLISELAGEYCDWTFHLDDYV